MIESELSQTDLIRGIKLYQTCPAFSQAIIISCQV